MMRHLLKTSVLFIVFLISSPFATAEAGSLNGAWLTDSGDLLFMVKSTKGNVIAMDVSAEKELRYVFTGSINGDQLVLETRDGSASLNATVSGETLDGVLTAGGDAPQDINATLYFAYKGSAYDGLWKTDAVEDYLLYATLKLKGVVTTVVPYFSINSDQSVAYNVFMGVPASTDSKGNTAFAGISLLDYSILKLGFASDATAAASLIKGQEISKFNISKIYAVTKKSGEF